MKCQAQVLHVALFAAYKYLVQPVRTSFGVWLTKSKTKKGMQDLHRLWALDREVTTAVDAMLQRLRGGDGWHTVGFNSGIFGRLARTRQCEEELAQRMLLFAIALGGLRIASKQNVSKNLPGLFVLLLSPEEHERATVLQTLKAMWDTVCMLERRAKSDAQMEAALKSIIWPGFGWVREILVSLSEYNFEVIPHEVAEAVEIFFHPCSVLSYASSASTTCRSCSRQTRGGRPLDTSAGHH